MAENPRYTRRGRTHFSAEQLQALRRVFEMTWYPDWTTMEELISVTHLDESVIKTWFKNQRVKRKKEGQEPNGSNSSQQSPNSTIQGEEGKEPSSPVTHGNPRVSHRESSQSSENDQLGSSRSNSCWDFQTAHLEEICLGDSNPPWASSPYDIEQFRQIYALPGNDSPSSLDQYLSPKYPH